MAKRSRAHRAQMFQSFDALKGFREILREQERVEVPKVSLMEDELDSLDRKIHQVKLGMMVSVVYFDRGKYYQMEGVVSKINLDTRIIQIVKTKLNLKDIVAINGEELDEFF